MIIAPGDEETGGGSAGQTTQEVYSHLTAAVERRRSERRADFEAARKFDGRITLDEGRFVPADDSAPITDLGDDLEDMVSDWDFDFDGFRNFGFLALAGLVAAGLIFAGGDGDE